MNDLEMTVAQAFKLRGKSRLNRTELTFALAYELKWFTPDECKEIIDTAVKQGILKEAGGKLSPAFNLKAMDIPKDFRPGLDVLNEKSLFDRLLDMFGNIGVDRENALVLIGNKQNEYGGLVTPETAALVIAKEKGLDIGPYIDEAFTQLLQKKA